MGKDPIRVAWRTIHVAQDEIAINNSQVEVIECGLAFAYIRPGNRPRGQMEKRPFGEVRRRLQRVTGAFCRSDGSGETPAGQLSRDTSTRSEAPRGMTRQA